MHPILERDDPTDDDLPDRLRWPETEITDEPTLVTTLAGDPAYVVRDAIYDPAWVAATLGVEEARLRASAFETPPTGPEQGEGEWPP